MGIALRAARLQSRLDQTASHSRCAGSRAISPLILVILCQERDWRLIA
jgi:hypothetical protein